MNILIPNIGRRGYLVAFLKKTPNFKGKVFVSDCDNTASGLYGNNDGAFVLPKPADNEEKYVNLLCNLCIDKNIDIVIPVIDPEIFILSKYNELFSKNNIFVSVSDKSVLDICYNKLLMNDFLLKNGFDVPKTYKDIESFKEALNDKLISFPVIIKPIYGSGSVSTYYVDSIEKIYALFSEGMIIQEVIKGQEYGADVFNDLNGNTVRCVIKRKIAMRSGETDKSETIQRKDLQKVLISMGQKLRHICNLDCDILEKDNHYYIIDLNPRFGGGYPATHLSGVNLLSLVCDLSEGNSIHPDFSYKYGLFFFKEVSIVSTDRLI